MADDKNIKNSK